MRWHLRGATIVLAVFAGMAVQAETLPPDAITEAESGIRRAQAAEAADHAAHEAVRKPKVSDQAAATAGPDPFASEAGGPCFLIRDIILTGEEAFGLRPEGYRHLVGQCATAADVGSAVNRINTDYQAKGFITTRAYVPEQDLADGSLEITIVPGRIEGYAYGNGAPADARVHNAFPTGRGALLNLRDLEQGLDNINAPKSANGKFQLIPSEKPGGSFVQVFVEDRRRWNFDLSVNNTGFASTGQTKATANLGFDNVLGVNDQLSFGLTSTPFDARKLRYSDAVSLSWNAPIGKWSFGLDLGGSGYFFILPGINQSYPVEGRSSYASLSAERLLTRSQTAKLYAFANLKLSGTQTFIDNHQIESQRQRLAILDIGLRGEKTFGQGKLKWSVGGKAGLDAFNAYVFDKSTVDPQFRLLNASLGFEHPLGKAGVTYKGALTAQHSDSILPSTEQISIGGWSTVRGFHDDSMYGDSGIYLSNTVEWDAWKGDASELKLNAGLDLGSVKPSALRQWSQNHLVGISLGADLKVQKQLTLTLQVAHALSRPEEDPPNAQPAFEANRTVGYLGLKMEF